MIKSTEGARTTAAHPAGGDGSRDMVENGASALETCPIFKQVSDVSNV